MNAMTDRRLRERRRVQEQILNAARELFIAQGYEAVTMRQIGKKIGYSATALYTHFADKETLLRQLCTHDFLRLATTFQKLVRIADPIERLRKIGLAYAEFGLRSPNHYRFMFMSPHPAMAPNDREIEKNNPEQDAYALLKQTITQAMASKRFRRELTDVALIAQTVWAAVHGVVALQIIKSDDPWVDWRSIKRRVNTMIDIMILGLARD